MINLTVSKTGSDDNCFPTLSEAISRIPNDTDEPVTIFLTSGIYHEKITIERPYVTLVGEDKDTTVIAFDDCANQIMPDGRKRGTFRSYTMFLNSHDITLSDLTIRNEAFPRSKAGQALALYADGDRLVIKNCRLESYQDTLFTGPLPPAPLASPCAALCRPSPPLPAYVAIDLWLPLLPLAQLLWQEERRVALPSCRSAAAPQLHLSLARADCPSLPPPCPLVLHTARRGLLWPKAS